MSTIHQYGELPSQETGAMPKTPSALFATPEGRPENRASFQTSDPTT